MELKDILEKILEDISQDKDINVSDIPCVDLYMDQVTSFFEDKLGYLRRDDEDKILTKTMINNYTKAKILMPAKSKKYTKQHMILLILIYHLKQILSINDIDMLLTPFIANDENGENNNNVFIEEMYNTFLQIKKDESENFKNEMENNIDKISAETSKVNYENKDIAEVFITVLTLINSANIHKRMAEKIIDNYFSKEKK